MKVLVLGGQGMLGSELVRSLDQRYEIHATSRNSGGQFGPGCWHFGVDVRDIAAVRSVLDRVKPAVAINAVGIVKQVSEQVPAEVFIEVNALFPHRLARHCGETGIRLIHISTDCVFSGARGGYVETDLADPIDVYGMTKLLGEPSQGHSTTLRCSMIGIEQVREGQQPRGLIGWFKMQSGEISGYSRSIFNGLTTREIARILVKIIDSCEPPRGLWHIGAEPISKFDLLQQIADRLPERGVIVRPTSLPSIDRTLNSTSFAKVTGYRAPSWDTMLDELASDIRVSER